MRPVLSCPYTHLTSVCHRLISILSFHFISFHFYLFQWACFSAASTPYTAEQDGRTD